MIIFKLLAVDNNQLCNQSTSSSSSSIPGLQRLKSNMTSPGKNLPPTGSSASYNNSSIISSDNSITSTSTTKSTSDKSTLESTPNLKTSITAPKSRRNVGSMGTKQRSFTTSILVSPRSDRKFAAILAARHKQLSKEGNATDLATANNHYDNNSLSYNMSSLDTRKLRDTARSYQRLAQEEDFHENENSVKSNFKGQEKKTLCSGEVIVDIKKVLFF